MNNRFSVQTNRLFIVYILLGTSYLVFLVLFSLKVFPGFIMQVLFLIEAVTKDGITISSLFSNTGFLESLIAGIFTLLLIGIFVKGLYKSIKQYIYSRKYLNNIEKSSINSNYITINTTLISGFTAGFIHPQIYISESLKKILKQDNLKAIIYHEKSHQKDRDPLRGFIVLLIHNILPIFPYKNILLNLFKTSIELKCDQNSIRQLGNKTSIIEALYSILKYENSLTREPYLTYFSSMPSRISVLVGKEKFNFKSISKLVSTFIVVASLLPVIALSSQFYMCEHIGECLRLFVQDLNSSSVSSLCNKHPMSTTVSCSVN